MNELRIADAWVRAYDVLCFTSLKHMKNADRLQAINVENTPQEILGILRFFDPLIGMRFHSIIFSMMKVPAVALIYDTKTVELLKRRGNEHRCVSIMLSELDADKLKSKINKLLG